MKLEGLDPVHPSLFCVLTVAEVTEFALCFCGKLHVAVGCPIRIQRGPVCPNGLFINGHLFLSVCMLSPQVQGYRVRLHFDGYQECYDFWVNADSWDVKPPGWCEKSGLKLLLPKGEWTHKDMQIHLTACSYIHFLTLVNYLLVIKSHCSKLRVCLWPLCTSGCREGEFNWSTYVKNCRGQLAPKHLFKSLNTVRSTLP